MDKIYKILILIGLAAGSIFPQAVYYSQNFEGTVDMTASPSSGGCEFGTPTYSAAPLTVPEESKCAGTELDCPYELNTIYRLTSPAIILPDSSTKSLTVSSGSNRTTALTGTNLIEPFAPYSITATANFGCRFSDWTIESGSATIANLSLPSTTVQISENATIMAFFIQGTPACQQATISQNHYQLPKWRLLCGS